MKIKTERVAIFPVVCFTDSPRANPKQSQTRNLKRSRMRKANKNQYVEQPGQTMNNS